MPHKSSHKRGASVQQLAKRNAAIKEIMDSGGYTKELATLIHDGVSLVTTIDGDNAETAVITKEVIPGTENPRGYGGQTRTIQTDKAGNVYDKEGKNIPEYEVVPPTYVKPFTEILRTNGYYCANNFKCDYQFNAPFTAWDEVSSTVSYRDAPKDKPFFYVWNTLLTHESRIWERSNQPLVGIDARGKFNYANIQVEIDEKLLTQISEMTGGKYFRATDNESLKDIYSDIDKLEKTEIEEFKYYSVDEKFRYFLVPAILLIVFELIMKLTILRSFI